MLFFIDKHLYAEEASIPLNDQWLINVLLPNHDTDLIVAHPRMSAMELYFRVCNSAAEMLEVGGDDIFSLYANRHYAAYKCSIAEFGFYNCCTVTVHYLHEWCWTIYCDIPDGKSITVAADDSMTPSELHSNVLEKAADYFDTDPGKLYSLFQGKCYSHHDSLTIKEFGFDDGSRVTVYPRLLGGVCVSNKRKGKRRTVSTNSFTF